jgi:hypothetical protein
MQSEHYEPVYHADYRTIRAADVVMWLIRNLEKLFRPSKFRWPPSLYVEAWTNPPRTRYTTFACRLVLHTDLNQHQMQIETIQLLCFVQRSESILTADTITAVTLTKTRNSSIHAV